jgi:Serine carboxypeptidase
MANCAFWCTMEVCAFMCIVSELLDLCQYHGNPDAKWKSRCTDDDCSLSRHLFSGFDYIQDTDPAINSFAAQNWTSHLGLTEIQPWRPWTSDGCRRMGGYVTRYEGDFDFLTIRGAGHMVGHSCFNMCGFITCLRSIRVRLQPFVQVPANKAKAAFTFIKAWIEGDDYPTYDENCVAPKTQQEESNTIYV